MTKPGMTMPYAVYILERAARPRHRSKLTK